MNLYRRIGKRTLDLVVASGLLALTAPLQIGLAVLSRCIQGSPVLFRQQRAGRHGKPFGIVKFRTMVSDDGRDREERVTPLGRALRRSSLDELPQLWNVVRGDMSLVGPRPLHLRYTDRYSSRQRRRLEVRPGITGLAQIAGRNAVPWDDRLELDVKYIEDLSFFLDAKIILSTGQRVVAALFSRGRKSETVPSSEFLGAGGTESL